MSAIPSGLGGGSIPVVVEMGFKADEAMSSVRKFQREVGQIFAELSKQELSIPLRVDDKAIRSFANETGALLAKQAIPVRIAIDQAAVKAAVESLQAQLQAQPLQIPVQLRPTGGSGSGSGAAARGEDKAGPWWKFSGAGASTLGLVFAGQQVARSIGTDIDLGVGNRYIQPSEDLARLKSNVEESGSALYRPLTATAEFFGGASVDEKLQAIRGGERAEAAANLNISRMREHAGRAERERDLVSEGEAELSQSGLSSSQRQRALADKALQKAIDAADRSLDGIREGTGAYEAQAKLAGEVKRVATRIHDRLIKEIDDEEKAALAQMGTEATVRQRRLSGDFTGARRGQLEESIQRETEALRKRDPALAAFFTQNIAPQMTAEFNQTEARTLAGQRFASGQVVAGYREAGIEARLRAGGRGEEADLRGRNFAITQDVARMREAVNLEPDAVKRRQLQDQATAAAQAGELEKAANVAEHKKRIEDSVTAYAVEASATRLRAAGKNYEAETAKFDAEWAKRIRDAGSNEERVAAISGRDAARAGRQAARDRDTREIEIGTDAQLLRNDRRSKAAEALEASLRIQKDLEDASGDARRTKAVRESGIAELEGIRRGPRAIASIGSDDDAFRTLQTNALDAGRDAGTDKGIMAMEKVLGSGGSFADATKSLKDGAEALKKVKVVGVITDY